MHFNRFVWDLWGDFWIKCGMVCVLVGVVSWLFRDMFLALLAVILCLCLWVMSFGGNILAR